MASAYLSWHMDDPENNVAFAWFPAGVSVAAFFAHDRRRWPLLFIVFLASGYAVDLWQHHPPTQSAWIRLVSVSSDVATAWLSQAYARQRDDLHAVLGWLFTTVLVSALAAVTAIGGVAAVQGQAVLAGQTFWNIAYGAWGSNVSGVLFTVAILMGFIGFRRVEATPSPRAYAVAAIAWLLLAACTWYAFDTQHLPQTAAPWLMALTCVPLALAVLVTLAGGDRMGSLAMITMAAIVLYHSDQGLGPFFLGGFLPGESLLLAQCYLVAAAMLLVFVRILTRSFTRLRTQGEDERLYRLDLACGSITWDDPVRGGCAPGSLREMLACVHPEDRQALGTRLSGLGPAAALSRPFSFRYAEPGSPWVTIIDTNRGAIPGAAGTWIVGSWKTLP
ncbi:MASE1 domain-containing protein [Bordetella sp.]|uniref:MASE1 domain-containing protein n=1 Tax=Bordetella sp. TaxID=28081 RepID=UPI0039C8B74D